MTAGAAIPYPIGPGPRAGLRAVLVAATVLALPTVARAQRAGWSLDRHEPTPAGDVFAIADHPEFTGAQRRVVVRAAITADHALRPLAARTAGGASAIVSHHLVGHLGLDVAALDRFAIGLSLPISLALQGQSQGTMWNGSAPAMGDLRLHGRVRIFGSMERDVVAMHAGAALFVGAIPWSSPTSLATERNASSAADSMRGRIHLGIGGRRGMVRWSFTGGYHARPRTLLDGTDTSPTVIGSELTCAAGVGIALVQDAVNIQLEGSFATTLERAFTGGNTHIELLAGVGYRIARAFRVGVGVGPGIVTGPGTPVLRTLLTLAYAPAEGPIPR